MAELPADVRDQYRRLAAARRWSPETEAAFLRTVMWFRDVDEGPGTRGYYERDDEEGLAEQGTRWLWETVVFNGAVIAVKQMEILLQGPVRRYWWRWLEDDASGLTDQPRRPSAHHTRRLLPGMGQQTHCLGGRIGSPAGLLWSS